MAIRGFNSCEIHTKTVGYDAGFPESFNHSNSPALTNKRDGDTQVVIGNNHDSILQ